MIFRKFAICPDLTLHPGFIFTKICRMKILWITYTMLPPIAEAESLPVPFSGGWVYSSLRCLADSPDIEAGVAIPYRGRDFRHRKIEGVDYFLIPMCGKLATEYHEGQNEYFAKVKEIFNPDVVHIHGTEYPHGLNWLHACGPDNMVVSIQGLVSQIALHTRIDHEGRLPFSFRDFIKRDGIKGQSRDFARRGEIECEIIRNARHIIGRTDWDRAHVWALNPDADYHYCSETLRPSFYSHKWNYADCEPCSIFVSQAGYPIKGLHMLMQAIPLILREFPETKIYVAGDDPTTLPLWRISTYGRYLKELSRRLNLRDRIIFTGPLSEEQMLQRYLKSNLFVCCSAIENSPNSLGEALMLGMPCLSSFAGGAPDIAGYNPHILYRFEEPVMLAQKACDIFRQREAFSPETTDTSKYDPEANLRRLKEIYREISQC